MYITWQVNWYHIIMHAPSGDWSTKTESCNLWSKCSTSNPPRLEFIKNTEAYFYNFEALNNLRWKKMWNFNIWCSWKTLWKTFSGFLFLSYNFILLYKKIWINFKWFKHYSCILFCKFCFKFLINVVISYL